MEERRIRAHVGYPDSEVILLGLPIVIQLKFRPGFDRVAGRISVIDGDLLHPAAYLRIRFHRDRIQSVVSTLRARVEYHHGFVVPRAPKLLDLGAVRPETAVGHDGAIPIHAQTEGRGGKAGKPEGPSIVRQVISYRPHSLIGKGYDGVAFGKGGEKGVTHMTDASLGRFE